MSFATIAAAIVGLLAVPQDKPDDMVQLKDGTPFVGRILSVTDTGVEMQLKSGGKVTLEFKRMAGSHAYRIKVERIDPNNAQAHYDLAEWCVANGLYSYAIAEFDKAAQLDPSLAEKAKTNREKALNEDARSRFEDAKRLVAARDYEGAERILSLLLTNFKDTPWAKEAQTEMAKVTEEVKKANEEKRRLLEEKQKAKADAVAKKGEEVEKTLVQQTVDAVEQAKMQWADGLDWEGKPNLTKADRAWRMSEAYLLTAKRNTEQLLKSNDVEIIKLAKDVDKDIDLWLIRTYYRLGRMWAAEMRYSDAMTWLNKGIRLSPDDHLLNETLLTLTQMEMRKRANASAPKGY